jgi:cytochrome P450
LGEMLQQWVFRNFAPAVRLLPLNFPGMPYHGYLRLAERIEKKILELIAKRRAKPGTYNDVLALLIAARDEESHGMTDTELVGQTAVLFSASMETTSTALMWTLFLLAQHPVVMKDVMNELDSVLNGGIPTPEQLKQLRLLNAVIKESMRVLAPVPYTVRSTTTTVSIGPYRVPDGSRIVCSHFLTHHLPELYPEPNRFSPERWNSIDPNQYEYLPFSAGPRICVGAAFATQVIQISLAMLLQKFRFAVVPGTRIDRVVRITMQPRGGMPMLLVANDRKFSASKVHGQIHEMVDLP